MSLKCPECGNDNITTERRLNGESRCIMCGHRDLTTEFERHNEVSTYKELESRLSTALSIIEVLEKSNDFYSDLKSWEPFTEAYSEYVSEFSNPICATDCINYEDIETFENEKFPSRNREVGGKLARSTKAQIEKMKEGL